jgi:hypothetical protein
VNSENLKWKRFLFLLLCLLYCYHFLCKNPCTKLAVFSNMQSNLNPRGYNSQCKSGFKLRKHPLFQSRQSILPPTLFPVACMIKSEI